MLITTEIHNYCIARTEGEVNRENKQLFFKTVSYPSRKQQQHLFLIILYYKLQEKKTQGKVGSYTGESILLEDQVHIARRPMTSRRKNEHNRSNVLAQ